MSKNIVICCDGTNNEVWGNQTNVLRLFRMLIREPSRQIAYYDAGIGTHADPTAHTPLRRRLYRKLDSAVGLGVRDNVLEAYRFLMRNHVVGDRVYLFGFSRGAYTVRALAAMLMRVGLLNTEHENLAAHAWAVFTDEDGAGDDRARFGGAARIKKVFARRVGVHMVGVWDTVSSFGWVWDPLMIPNTARCEDVSHVRHAISIDERRAYFRPNHFRPPAGQDALCVWFPGVHADVGGGYPETEGGLSKIALEWMMGEATALGLLLDERNAHEQLRRVRDKHERPECGAMHDESVKPGWRLLGLLPKRVYSPAKDAMAWRWPNPAHRRQIVGEPVRVHESVLARMGHPEMGYKPDLPEDYEVVKTRAWG